MAVTDGIKIILLISLLLFSSCDSAKTDTNEHRLFLSLEKLAKDGNPEAQYDIGMMYNNGLGVSQDPAKAFEWFRKAADAGEPLASYKVGCYYAGQFGVVEMDLAKAREA